MENGEKEANLNMWVNFYGKWQKKSKFVQVGQFLRNMAKKMQIGPGGTISTENGKKEANLDRWDNFYGKW